MQYLWMEGFVNGVVATREGDHTPITLQFLNNGALSITVGNDTFSPNEQDLKVVFEWAEGLVKALGIPSENVVVGAWKGNVTP